MGWIIHVHDASKTVNKHFEVFSSNYLTTSHCFDTWCELTKFLCVKKIHSPTVDLSDCLLHFIHESFLCITSCINWVWNLISSLKIILLDFNSIGFLLAMSNFDTFLHNTFMKLPISSQEFPVFRDH